MSPTQRSLKLLRISGHAVVVEKWVAPARKRVDAFGFGDILWCGEKPTLVQTTTGSNLAARKTKILTECRDAALAWLRCGGAVHLHGWSLSGPRGQRKVWSCRIVEITEGDFV